MQKSAILLLCLLVVGLARFRPDLFEQGYSDLPAAQPQVYSQNQYWFDQILDHYDYSSNVTWRQRYWVLDTFFNPKNGSVILYICGEWVCSGITPGLGGVTEIAASTNSLVISVEHRFYG
jgi:hypothetical protein